MLSNSSSSRASNFELLRILSMIMIVAHHFAYHGGFSFSASDVSVARLWIDLLFMAGKVSINVFVLISGYFLILEKETVWNVRRILKFWGQVAFYSVSVPLIFSLCRHEAISIDAWLRMLFPISFSGWWFASTYFVLYLLHPFLNRLLRGLDKPTYQKFLALILICRCIIPNAVSFERSKDTLSWFIFLYSVAAYIRLFDPCPNFKRKHYFALWLSLSALTFLAFVALCLLGAKQSVFLKYTGYAFFDHDKLPILLISVFLFMIFEKTNIPTDKRINKIASAAFGVYLIHDNGFVCPFLWGTVFKNADYAESAMLIPYSVFAVLLVYVLSTVIDLARKRLFEKPFLKLVDLVAEKLK